MSKIRKSVGNPMTALTHLKSHLIEIISDDKIVSVKRLEHIRNQKAVKEIMQKLGFRNEQKSSMQSLNKYIHYTVKNP